VGDLKIVETALTHKGRHTHGANAPAATHLSITDHQVFRLNLDTILCAHLYGHINEAYALRAIARAIQEFLI